MKVAVFGNCQARPLAAALSAASAEVGIVGTVIVHLAKQDDADQVLAGLADADVVLAQRVADDYPTPFVRTQALREHFGDKLVVWPNLYYRGYNPELIYLRDSEHRPLQGPMGDYHLGTIHDSWRAGLPPEEAVRRLKDVDFNKAAFSAVPETSLTELREREADSDVIVSDHVAEHRWERRLFHTFNHPTRELLDVLAGRVLDRLSLPRVGETDETEPLGRWQMPLNVWVKQEFAPNFWDRPRFLGADVDLTGPAPRALPRPVTKRNYSELVKAYYEVYDSALA